MPRIDNSNQEVIEAYTLEFDENDPGRTSPVDLCYSCYFRNAWDRDGIDIDHPPYESGGRVYKCLECDEILTADDN